MLLGVFAALASVASAGSQAFSARFRTADANRRVIRISRWGRIGALRLNVSTPADVERQWGPPEYTLIGNVAGSILGFPNYTLLAYRCRLEGGYTSCAVDFYISQRTQRLESFTTTSRQFVLFGGVRVGMSADVASAREHRPDESGCGQQIYVSTTRMMVDIWTRGGHEYARRGGRYVAGGRVTGIGIDDAHHGVGVLFC